MTTYSAKDIHKFGDKITARVERITSRMGMEAFRSVVERSPVKTGWFQNSWQYSETQEKPAPRIPPKPKKGEVLPPPDMPVQGEHPKWIWIINNLDYGPALEAGHSKRQAKDGVVGPTMRYLKAILPGVVYQESKR